MSRFFLWFCLLVSLAHPARTATPYPCDIAPAPVLCFGTAKLASAYGGNAIDAYNPNTTATQSIAFSGDALDTAALDTFLNGQIGLVTRWYGQKNGANLTQTVVSTEAPSIQGLAIGGARSIVFQGESQSGALYSLVSGDISALGITAKDYSVILVVAPSSSMYCNQAGAPDLSSGVLTDLQGSGGTVARLYNDSVLGDRGAWEVTDGGAFDFVSPTAFVQLNPLVIGVTSDSSGVKVWQNGQIRATASRSALTRTASALYLGKLIDSVVGRDSHAGGFQIVAALIYAQGLTQQQYAFVAAALYQRFSIVPSVSGFAANYVAVLGDSIPAGYKTLGIYGYASYLAGMVSQPARVANMAVPGSTLTQNPAGGPVYANTLGLFPLAVTPVLGATAANKGRVVVIHGGGNDSGFGPSGRAGTTHGTTTIDGIASTADLSVGDYVYAGNLPLLTKITGKGANSITVDHAPTSSTTLNLTFTYAATTPAAIMAGVQSLVDSSIAAGATKVIVSTVLPRVADYQPWLSALNVLILAGGSGNYTIVDCAAYPGLNTNPGPSYADSAHLTALGHQQMAACLLSAVNSGLQ